MTSSTLRKTSNQDRLRHGFTLVEMLVVVGIIVVLVGILMPALSKAHTRAMRARMQLDIQTLVAAMESYKADMRDYPHIDYNDASLVGGAPGGVAPAASNPGAVTLCSALVGPGAVNVDGYGATGTGTGIQGAPGFTIRPQGQVYGPYVEVSRFKFITDPTMSNSLPNTANNLESTLCLADRYSHPILYFKANVNAAYRLGLKQAPPPGSAGFVDDVGPLGAAAVGSYPFYNYEDNPVAMRWPGETDNLNGRDRMRMMLGNKGHDGWINAFSLADQSPENPNSTSAYLIWSAGPDELFGFDPSDSGANPTPPPGSIGTLGVAYTRVSNSDDATNFSY